MEYTSESIAKFINEKAEYIEQESQTWKILIVDDEVDIHDVTIMALRKLTFDSKKLEFISAYSGVEAKEKIKEYPDIAIGIIDVVMEEDNAGLELVKFIREELGNENIRLILRTGNPGKAPEETVTMNYDINDYRGKTELTALSLRTMIITALRSYKAIYTIKGLNKEIDKTQKELIYSLSEIAEFRSKETGHHVKRVGEITNILGKKIGLPDEILKNISLAASMHDLGKIAIDDSIINKPGRLTEEEFEIMKTHTVLGYEILNKSKWPLLRMAATIALEHHENYDGTGYPHGLKGDEINIISSIVALVDVVDALGNKRVYKEAWTEEEINDYIISEKGKKFAPQIVELYFECISEINEIREKNQMKLLK